MHGSSVFPSSACNLGSTVNSKVARTLKIFVRVELTLVFLPQTHKHTPYTQNNSKGTEGSFWRCGYVYYLRYGDGDTCVHTWPI